MGWDKYLNKWKILFIFVNNGHSNVNGHPQSCNKKRLLLNAEAKIFQLLNENTQTENC